MAKQTILKERGTGEILYPQTLASCVQTADGDNVDNALDEAKLSLFIDMWESRCRFGGKEHYFGKYNRETGFFELNEITDITYEEALQIWALSRHQQLGRNSNPNDAPYACLFGGTGYNQYNAYSKCRTYFPIFHGGGYTYSNLKLMFSENHNVETLNFVGGCGNALSDLAILYDTFSGCTSLRKILCYIGFPKTNDNTFRDCQALEYVNIKTYIDNRTINFRWSPDLSYESLNLLVSQAIFHSNDPNHEWMLTVTVHADVYAKLTGDTTNEAAAALTPEELAAWQQVLADAVEKNITFATA